MKTLIGVLLATSMFVLPATASFAQGSKIVVTVVSPNTLTPDSSPQTREAEKEVCRKPRVPIGTRFPGPTICKTQRQWDTEMYEEQHNIAKSQIRGCLASGACPQ